MIMGHVGDTTFLPGQKKIYYQVTWVIRLFSLGKKPISPHSEHSAVFPLTPHTISNRTTMSPTAHIDGLHRPSETD